MKSQDNNLLELEPIEVENVELDLPTEFSSLQEKSDILIDFSEKQQDTNKKDYINRNNKRFYKTSRPYIYKCENGGYAYRIVHKPTKTNTFVLRDLETKLPFMTEKQAYEAQQQHLHRLDENPSYRYRKATFGEVWELFQKNNYDRANETIRRYSSIYNNHIKSVFGEMPLSEIKPIDFSEYLTKMHKTGEDMTGNTKKSRIKYGGYSYAYVESFLKFFYLVMGYASRNHIISYSQFLEFQDNIAMPKKKKKSDNKKIRVLNQEQLDGIKAELTDTDFYLPFLISITCGTRPAETFALCFSDFDFKNKTVTIDKQIVDENGLLVLKNPKTENSTRTIDVPDATLTEVKKKQRYLTEQKSLKEKFFAQNHGKVYDDRNFNNELIDMPDFVCRDGKGRYITAHSFSYYTKIIKKKYCPPLPDYEDFSFYTFRKTHLSYMAASNCPVGDLMIRAGHSKIETLYKSYYAPNETSIGKMRKALKEATEII